jgi:hypothetical protein
MAATARSFSCSRQLVSARVNEDPELRDLVDELTETFIDYAESKLFKAINEGNIAATIFFLKTRAKHRGYCERYELSPVQARGIEIELGAPTSENSEAEALDSDRPAVALLEQ